MRLLQTQDGGKSHLCLQHQEFTQNWSNARRLTIATHLILGREDGDGSGIEVPQKLIHPLHQCGAFLRTSISGYHQIPYISEPTKAQTTWIFESIRNFRAILKLLRQSISRMNEKADFVQTATHQFKPWENSTRGYDNWHRAAITLWNDEKITQSLQTHLRTRRNPSAPGWARGPRPWLLLLGDPRGLEIAHLRQPY